MTEQPLSPAASPSVVDWLVRLRMLIVLVLLLVGATLLTEDYMFARSANLVNVMRQISFEALIAFGMTLIIITGGIDLSVGSLVALTGVAAGLTMRTLAADGAVSGGTAVTAGMGVGIATGAAFGTLSGSIITRFALPPFIVTLAGMLVARGMAFILCDGKPIHSLPDALDLLGPTFVLESWLGRVLPVSVLVMLVGFALFWLLLVRTVFGRSIIAVGSNEEAARLAGIPVRRTKLLAYVLTGALCGVAGVLHAAKLGTADPKAGDMWELYVIAAVVVGGTSLFGGRGTIPGTLVGALIIGVLNNSLNLLQVENFWQKVVLGLVILGAGLLDAALSRLGRR